MLTKLHNLSPQEILDTYSRHDISIEQLDSLANTLTKVTYDPSIRAYVSGLSIAQQVAIIKVFNGKVKNMRWLKAVNIAIQGYWTNFTPFTHIFAEVESDFYDEIVKANISNIHFSLALLESHRLIKSKPEWIHWVKEAVKNNTFTPHYTLAEYLPKLEAQLNKISE